MGHKFKIDISIHIDDDSDKFFGDVFMSDMKNSYLKKYLIIFKNF